MSQVVIVHGWSDTSKSFEPLAEFLRSNEIAVTPIYLGDYISLDDDVRVEDVAKRMHAVFDARLETGELHAPFDMIVHSTGGLVARQWLAEYFPDGGSPRAAADHDGAGQSRFAPGRQGQEPGGPHRQRLEQLV